MKPGISTIIKDSIKLVEDFPVKGVSFKDISGLFHRPDKLKAILTEAEARLEGKDVDIIYGIESRGFLLALPLALQMSLPFGMVRKKGKLPGPVLRMAYDLEYGKDALEIQIPPPEFKCALLVDDVLATGGTAEAALRLLRNSGLGTANVLFLVELIALNGRFRLEDENTEVISLAQF